MVKYVALFRHDNYSALISLLSPSALNKHQLLALVYQDLPIADGQGAKTLELSNDQGEVLLLRDEKREGSSWLASYLVESPGDSAIYGEESATPPFIQPIFRRGSYALRAVLLFAGLCFVSDIRFGELRRLIKTLQYICAFGWDRDVNLAYLGSSSGGLRLRRGFVLGVLYLILPSSRWVLVGILLTISYLIFSTWRNSNVF